MKRITIGYPLLFLLSFAVSAQTPSEYDVLYDKCLDESGAINNTVVAACSEIVSEKSKSEITRRYQSIYDRLLNDNSEDAQKFESSHQAWLVYRNTHCDLAGAYIGPPMYGYCPMKLNSARALLLRQMDR